MRSISLFIVCAFWLRSTFAADEAVAPYKLDPYPSTYQPVDSGPFAITNATILDGIGGRIENGLVVVRKGKIVEWRVVLKVTFILK